MNFYYEKYVKDYQKTPKGKFIRQKTNAKRRGIPWEMTFEEWWSIWEKSGKWEQRGQGPYNYCMSRKFDQGPYSVNNVTITTSRKNSQQAFFHKIID